MDEDLLSKESFQLSPPTYRKKQKSESGPLRSCLAALHYFITYVLRLDQIYWKKFMHAMRLSYFDLLKGELINLKYILNDGLKEYCDISSFWKESDENIIRIACMQTFRATVKLNHLEHMKDSVHNFSMQLINEVHSLVQEISRLSKQDYLPLEWHKSTRSKPFRGLQIFLNNEARPEGELLPTSFGLTLSYRIPQPYKSLQDITHLLTSTLSDCKYRIQHVISDYIQYFEVIGIIEDLFLRQLPFPTLSKDCLWTTCDSKSLLIKLFMALESLYDIYICSSFTVYPQREQHQSCIIIAHLILAISDLAIRSLPQTLSPLTKVIQNYHPWNDTVNSILCHLKLIRPEYITALNALMDYISKVKEGKFKIFPALNAALTDQETISATIDFSMHSILYDRFTVELYNAVAKTLTPDQTEHQLSLQWFISALGLPEFQCYRDLTAVNSMLEFMNHNISLVHFQFKQDKSFLLRDARNYC